MPVESIMRQAVIPFANVARHNCKGLVNNDQPFGTTLCTINEGQPPKSSSMMFSGSTPRSTSILITEAFIIGGPHM